MKKVYIVTFESFYEDENTRIEKVFSSEKKAIEYTNKINKEKGYRDWSDQHYEYDRHDVE